MVAGNMIEVQPILAGGDTWKPAVLAAGRDLELWGTGLEGRGEVKEAQDRVSY